MAKIHTKDKEPTLVKDGLLKALEEVGLQLEPILCGGNNLINQEREQWTDGANLLAIAPGHILCYKRNRYTIEGLKKYNYTEIDASNIKHGDVLPNHEKFVITLYGNELSRGRGGPHCLTFPLERGF